MQFLCILFASFSNSVNNGQTILKLAPLVTIARNATIKNKILLCVTDSFHLRIINICSFLCVQCTDYELDYGTECLQLALKYGRLTDSSGGQVNVKLVDGPESLWKVMSLI